MDISIRIGKKVKLITFNGTLISDRDADDSEDYWKLIGETGVIQKDPYEISIFASFSKEPRVLVKFDKKLDSYGLTAHNNAINAIWILVSDLEDID